MSNERRNIQVKFLLLGILVGLGIFLSLGAKSQDDVVLLASDRYRVSSWGDLHSHGAFVIDSLTGKTKLVYQHFYHDSTTKLSGENATEGQEELETEEGGSGSMQQDHLGLPFTKIP